MAMELPDEAITYNYQSLLVPAGEEWTAGAELRAKHFLPPSRLKDLVPKLMQCRSQVAADREMRGAPSEMLPLEPGFIDLPQQSLDDHRRKGTSSPLGQVITLAQHLRDNADRVVVLGTGGAVLGARAIFGALRSSYHNDLPPETRLGVPCLYIEGDSAENETLQDLLELLQVTCVDPDRREERWAVVSISKSGDGLEPGIALRVFRREATEFYGLRSEWLKSQFAAVTAPESRLRTLFTASGHATDDVLTIPANVGSRWSVFTAAGLLPAAVLGLDVRALLLGAATMSKRFLEEPFERNPVLQFAGINHLMAEECNKPLRVMSVWSKKLEAVGHWYEHLVAEGLSKLGRGPTPLTLVGSRDLHVHGQQLQEGPRDRVINNVVIRTPRSVPVMIGMADHNEDGLNSYSRKGIPDVQSAALQTLNRICFESARPTADLMIPSLTEHAIGQLLQMLMLSTVVEGRLMGINPYSTPGSQSYQRQLREVLAK